MRNLRNLKNLRKGAGGIESQPAPARLMARRSRHHIFDEDGESKKLTWGSRTKPYKQ